MERQMAIEPRDFLTGAEWLIAGGTLMATTWIGIKKMYRVAKNVDTTLERIESVSAQLNPNGGNSLYDKVHQIAETQDQFKGDIEDIHGRLKRLEGYHMKPVQTRRRAKRYDK